MREMELLIFWFCFDLIMFCGTVVEHVMFCDNVISVIAMTFEIVVSLAFSAVWKCSESSENFERGPGSSVSCIHFTGIL